MERTEPHPLGTSLFELGVLSDYANDVGLVANLPYVLVDDSHGRTVPPPDPPSQPGLSTIQVDECLGHRQAGYGHTKWRARHRVDPGLDQ